jgi:5-methylcytosine-specific restriction endonuclease McrA
MRKGSKASPELKAKLSEVMKKWHEENPISEETRERQSKARRGKKHHYNLTPDGLARKKEKLRGRPSAFKGHKHSAEAKLAMSLAKKGKPSKRKGMHHTAESKLKMSLALKGKQPWLGKKHSEETKKLMSEIRIGIPTGRQPMLGKHHSDESKSRMSEAHKGNKYSLGVHPSEETREKFRQRMKGNKYLVGHKHSVETLEKMSQSQTGRKHSEETKAKIGRAGPENASWKGGYGKPNYGPGWIKCKRETRERDHSVCVICGEPVTGKKAIDVHHIIKVHDCRLKGLEPHIPANTACLCYKHHRWADDNDESIPMLQETLSARFGYSYYQGVPSQLVSLV